MREEFSPLSFFFFTFILAEAPQTSLKRNTPATPRPDLCFLTLRRTTLLFIFGFSFIFLFIFSAAYPQTTLIDIVDFPLSPSIGWLGFLRLLFSSAVVVLSHP